MKTYLKLNHATFETSLNGFVTSFLMLFVCGGIPYAFIVTNPYALSMIFDSIMATILLIVLITCIFLAFILSFCYYIKGFFKFIKQPMNIKSMIFDTKGINIVFNDKKLNRNYDYNNVCEMRLILHTVKTTNFSPSTYRSSMNLGLSAPESIVIAGVSSHMNILITEIEVCIIDKKGVHNSINVAKLQLLNTNMHKLLRQIVFFRQFIPKFSYSFDGPVEFIADNILKIFVTT